MGVGKIFTPQHFFFLVLHVWLFQGYHHSRFCKIEFFWSVCFKETPKPICIHLKYVFGPVNSSLIQRDFRIFPFQFFPFPKNTALLVQGSSNLQGFSFPFKKMRCRYRVRQTFRFSRSQKFSLKTSHLQPSNPGKDTKTITITLICVIFSLTYGF